MKRRTLAILALSLVAVAAAVLGGLLLSGRATAGGPGYGYGPGMMGGGYGPGMAGGAGAGAPSASPLRGATLLIRHQYAHCHTWSLSGGPFAARQAATLRRGATLRVVDDDVMPHRLVELAGAPVTLRNETTMPMMGGYVSRTPGLMDHMGASTTVRFAKPGVYRFRTRAGEDYVPGVRTGGADNVLRLTVTVR